MATQSRKTVAVVGAGPAGLMAAERLAASGLGVTVFDRMPSVARKFLMAGRGGLNLTHSEPLDVLLTRYGTTADPKLIEAVKRFPPADVIAWAEALGQPTFVGTSGRVFPRSMKASPLLRAWLQRLNTLGVTVQARSTWTGFTDDGSLLIENGGVTRSERFDAVLLALGGASWPRLGSNAAWVPQLEKRGLSITRLEPANVGVQVAWSEHLKQRFAGKPLKRISVLVDGARGKIRGEAILATYGLEGGVIYAIGEAIRARAAAGWPVQIDVDLRPDMPLEALTEKLDFTPSKQSLANTLRKSAGLDAVATALLYETVDISGPLPRNAAALAQRIKAVRLSIGGFEGLSRAISTAGGIAFAEIDDHFMLRQMPGVFIAGEMLDWSAPTGGYLLQACFATGRSAADGITAWLSLPKQ